MMCSRCGQPIVLRGPVDTFSMQSTLLIGDEVEEVESTVRCSQCLVIEEAESYIQGQQS